MTFEISESAIPSPWWFADISVYNTNDAATQGLLVAAQWVTLKAGYQKTGAQLIWSGSVMQVLYERENVVDYKITFHCLATNTKIMRGLNFNTAKNLSQAQAVQKMAAAVSGYQLTAPLPDQLSSAQNTYMRGKSYFGSIDKFYDQIAGSNNLMWFKSPQGSAMGVLDSGKDTPDYIYSAPLPANWTGPQPSSTTSYTIMGSPQQNDCGVTFSVLLDPRLVVKVPPLLVRIDNTAIRQITLTIPQNFVMPLAQDNSYVLAALRHRGDTRGDTWLTEVTGYTRAYTQGLIRGIFLTGQQ
jgi:hypothetical protein